MAWLYDSALVTISALSSADSTQDCRVGNPRAATHDRRFFDVDLGAFRIRLFEREILNWHEEYGDDTYRRGEFGANPLRRRAWTLQERELSARNIHFSQNLVLWECKTLKASRELPWHEVKPEDDFQPWPVRNAAQESLLPNGPVQARDRWYALMEDYMARILTKSSPTSYQHFWDLVKAFSVKYSQASISLDYGLTIYRTPYSGGWSLVQDNGRIQDKAQTSGNRADLKTLEAWETAETADGSIAGVIYLDVRNELQNDSQVWCVNVRPEPFWSAIQIPYELHGQHIFAPEDLDPKDAMVMGLAIQQDDNVASTFRRAGLVRWVKKSVLSGITSREFTLI
ncbi:hypothetical protein BDV96DRAFT_650646 [Lophiotrema nucula]|uniref:Heterokaryon incompatibility domain-containing protein n=1 Tax=Lophiotrema nucula TaxID=690887 RepID=A0A6A5YW84_9PLEO|nr:hypothetical protein BDV96DRAFT_650646 [Lophiotrema nucula]